MPKSNFNQRKKDVLSKLDKSSKGNWDKKIAKLCDKINKKENYYTTSSCAGRIVILEDKEKKGPGLFEFVSHDLIKDFPKINEKKNLRFKQEPCILHVACREFKGAEKLLKKAQLAGWKRSGIISSGKRFIVEMNGTEKLEFPLTNNGKIIVNEDFLKVVGERSNENLKKSWNKIRKLEKII